MAKKEFADVKIKRTDEEFKKAIIKHAGIVAKIAQELHYSRVGVHDRIKSNPELKALFLEQRELVIDEAESVVKDSIFIDRNVETAKWYLRNTAGNRFNETTVISGEVKVTHKVDLSNLSGEELIQLENLLRKTSDSSTGGSGNL